MTFIHYCSCNEQLIHFFLDTRWIHEVSAMHCTNAYTADTIRLIWVSFGSFFFFSTFTRVDGGSCRQILGTYVLWSVRGKCKLWCFQNCYWNWVSMHRRYFWRMMARTQLAIMEESACMRVLFWFLIGYVKYNHLRIMRIYIFVLAFCDYWFHYWHEGTNQCPWLQHSKTSFP